MCVRLGLGAMLGVLLALAGAAVALRCGQPRASLEAGRWAPGLARLRSAVVTARPVSAPEGLVRVYQANFPDHQIKYISVENKALRSCGAVASLVAGGLGQDRLVVVFIAKPNQEVRSVIDVWGIQGPSSIHKSKINLKNIAYKVRL